MRRSDGLLLWRFVCIKPRFYALIEGHAPIISYVSDPSEPLSILMEFGRLPPGVSSDYADAYPFLSTLELPPDVSPRLREDVRREERLASSCESI